MKRALNDNIRWNLLFTIWTLISLENFHFRDKRLEDNEYLSIRNNNRFPIAITKLTRIFV